MQSSIKPREGRHELSLGFAQHLKHMSPLQGFYTTGVLPMAYAMGYNLSPPFGAKVSATGLASERLVRN